MIWVLLIVYQIKHFVADYPLQGPYMLRKFLPTPHWILPLMAHAGVHGAFTCFIALFVKPEAALILGVLDFILHLTIDRLKASPNLGGRFKALDSTNYPGVKAMSEGDFLGAQVTGEEKVQKQIWAVERLKSNTYFWWALGADQGLHHLTHYLIIYLLLN
jgi:hypothetical protein